MIGELYNGRIFIKYNWKNDWKYGKIQFKNLSSLIITNLINTDHGYFNYNLQRILDTKNLNITDPEIVDIVTVLDDYQVKCNKFVRCDFRSLIAEECYNVIKISKYCTKLELNRCKIRSVKYAPKYAIIDNCVGIKHSRHINLRSTDYIKDCSYINKIRGKNLFLNSKLKTNAN
jgi:hypothetical protein